MFRSPIPSALAGGIACGIYAYAMGQLNTKYNLEQRFARKLESVPMIAPELVEELNRTYTIAVNASAEHKWEQLVDEIENETLLLKQHQLHQQPLTFIDSKCASTSMLVIGTFLKELRTEIKNAKDLSIYDLASTHIDAVMQRVTKSIIDTAGRESFAYEAHHAYGRPLPPPPKPSAKDKVPKF